MLYVLNFVLLLSVSCVFSQRDYSVKITGYDDGVCNSIDEINVYFISESGTASSTKLLSQVQSNGIQYSSTWSESDIGTIKWIDIAATTGDTVCFDYLEFSVNSTTTRACSGKYQGLWGVDSNCGDSYGSTATPPEIRLDVSESSPICWEYYNGDSNNTNKEPYYKDAAWDASASSPGGDRGYSVSFLTGTGTNCDTSGSNVSIQLQTNCQFSDGGTSYYCDTSTVVSTDYHSIKPGASGEWSTISFTDTDIGNVTYLYIEWPLTNSDTWCLDEFIVMIKYFTFGANDGLTIREYARCNISTFYYDGIIFDGDCAGDSNYAGYNLLTVRVDELAPYCDIYTERDNSSMPTTMPSDVPSMMPSKMPSMMPSKMPTEETEMPSLMPSKMPSMAPSEMPVEPSEMPSDMPSKVPSDMPSKVPTTAPVASGNMGVSNNNVDSMVYCLLLLFATLFVFVF